MTDNWATDLIERKGSGKGDISSLGYLALSLVQASRFTVDNETTSQRRLMEKVGAVTNTLEVAEHIIGLIIDAAEKMEDRLDK